MTAHFLPCVMKGTIAAPPSKSMAHRYLISAALSGSKCELSGIDYSEDILATIDCLISLGVKINIDGDKVDIDPQNFLKSVDTQLFCRESGSTLRFFIPLCLCTGKEITLNGSKRLFERPLEIYENICTENGFLFNKNDESVTICGKLESKNYTLKGNVSSQFITGLIFALVYLNEDASITILPPFESRSYVNLTISALRSSGADVSFSDEYTIAIKKAEMHGFSGTIEGDYSNAAFLDAFNFIGSDIKVTNLKSDSLQGDKVYKDYFEQIANGTPTLDISDCPDLGPVLFALAALKNGATFTGTDRLKVKESDRGRVMHEELSKLNGGLIFHNNKITVKKQNLRYNNEMLNGHNDHRIVMALSIILSTTGGAIDGIEAVSKSYPSFFDDLQKLQAKVDIK